MKPILTILFFVTLATLSSATEVLIQKDKTTNINNKQQVKMEKSDIRINKKYIRALSIFNSENYQESFHLFEQLLEKYPANKFIDFYYGRSAFELKNYEYAFTSFDRILINHPEDSRVRAEFARTLMMMNSFKEAKKEFEQVLLLPIPTKVRNNIKKLLKIIDSKEKNYIFNTVAIIGIGWDDNINNNTHLATTAYGSLDVNNDTHDKSDTYLTAILVGNLIVPSKKNSNITWETTAISYIQEQNKYKENNIQLLSFSTGIGSSTKKSKNLFGFTYDHIWIDGKQALYIYGLTNSLQYKINQHNELKLDLKFKNKKFSDIEDYDKNSNIAETILSYTKRFSNKKDTIKFSSSYIEERKTQGMRTDVDKNTNKYKISFNKNFLSLYDFSLGYHQELNKYLKMTTNLPKRDDEKRTLQSKVSYQISKTKILSLEYKNIKNTSNINVYTYKKQSVNLNYTLIF